VVIYQPLRLSSFSFLFLSFFSRLRSSVSNARQHFALSEVSVSESISHVCCGGPPLTHPSFCSVVAHFVWTFVCASHACPRRAISVFSLHMCVKTPRKYCTVKVKKLCATKNKNKQKIEVLFSLGLRCLPCFLAAPSPTCQRRYCVNMGVCIIELLLACHPCF
jgi:hypothetical protein